jgi:tRNA threonylcarbamoyladenosine biosynthesis protein TsaB
VSIVLNIDTAVQTSSICLAENDTLIGIKANPSQKDSSAWLHVALEELLYETNHTLDQVDAIAVSEGPGSYTGLRVGMATAKGLCYALHKPLITINTLKMMAAAVQNKALNLFCPMIDARRMEVFTAVFDKTLHSIVPPTNLILNENSFCDLLQTQTILFFGSGSIKFQSIIKHSNAVFEDIEITAASMVQLSYQKFLKREFADLAYSQPFYGKDFHSSIKHSL